jgi:aspartyl-tRNA(Asn)/glutamyl-tRNA(Gln) amidotransferase subunit C
MKTEEIQPIELDEVNRVAALARLTLTDAESQALTTDLCSILAYVQKLGELDTDAVAPTSHAVPLPSKWRSDETREGLGADNALRAAPERLGDGFGVPKIVE